jgi:hypothetical protein
VLLQEGPVVEYRVPRAIPRGEAPRYDRFWELFLRFADDITASLKGLPTPHVHVDPSTGEVADPATGGGGSERMFTYFMSGS